MRRLLLCSFIFACSRAIDIKEAAIATISVSTAVCTSYALYKTYNKFKLNFEKSDNLAKELDENSLGDNKLSCSDCEDIANSKYFKSNQDKNGLKSKLIQHWMAAIKEKARSNVKAYESPSIVALKKWQFLFAGNEAMKERGSTFATVKSIFRSLSNYNTHWPFNPCVNFDDIKGIVPQAAKDFIADIKFLKPLKLLNVNNDNVKGLLVYGQPGCGKTHLIQAIAGEVPEIPSFKINALSLIDLDEMRMLFRNISACSKKFGGCILFIQDASCLFNSNKSSSTTLTSEESSSIAKCQRALDALKYQFYNQKNLFLIVESKNNGVPAELSAWLTQNQIKVDYPPICVAKDYLKSELKDFSGSEDLDNVLNKIFALKRLNYYQLSELAEQARVEFYRIGPAYKYNPHNKEERTLVYPSISEVLKNVFDMTYGTKRPASRRLATINDLK